MKGMTTCLCRWQRVKDSALLFFCLNHPISYCSSNVISISRGGGGGGGHKVLVAFLSEMVTATAIKVSTLTS